MNEEISRIEKRMDHHEAEIAAIRDANKDVVTTHKELTKSIHELMLELRSYIVKHDHVANQNSELIKDVRALREKAAENQPVIDSIRQIAMKMFWLFISSLLTPAAMAALYFASSGGGK